MDGGVSMHSVMLAIVGCGAIADKHGQALSRIDGLAVKAVVDVREDRAKRFVDQYVKDPLQTAVFTDYRQALSSPDIDAVIIAAPSGLHYEIGSAALDAGKHTLMEKPLTLSGKEAHALVAKAEEKGVYLGTIHPNRHYPTCKMAYGAVRDGRLGKLSHVVATLRWNRTQAYYDEAPWRKTRAMDGGVLFNQAWHAIDQMLWLAGSSISTVQGMASKRLHDIETEDVAIAVIRFEDGTLGLIEATTNVYPRNLEQTVSVFGETGTIILGGNRADAIRAWRVSGYDENAVLAQWSEASAPKTDASWAHEQCIREFLEAVQRGRKGPSEDVLTAVQGIELICQIIGSC